MNQLSSSWTMPIKLFVPAFFGGILVTFFYVVWIYNIEANHLSTLRIVSLVLLLLGILIYWQWIKPLKRIDADNEYIYVTNYFKTLKYTIGSVEKIELNESGKRGRLFLKEKGSFGKKIAFMSSKPRVDNYLNSHTLGIPVEVQKKR